MADASFRASARTVDMLGRQQIAGIPTALSELFKNAHDAYASRVQADFVRESRLLVVRDDGLGMTRSDFLDRWLVLGTAKKGDDTRAPEPPKGRMRRPVLGEKGIGRLAIAAIGPQMLVITRPHEEAGDPGTMAFVNWSLFEVPGLNLDEIVVPLADLPPDGLPGHKEVGEVVEQARRIAGSIKSLSKAQRQRADRELRSFEFDPALLNEQLPGPGIEQGGTQFFIAPTVETLPPNLDEPVEEDGVPPMVMSLLGFNNTMRRDRPDDEIQVAFLDHKPAAQSVNVLDIGDFFTPDEFASADHHLRGTFNEFGQFKGTVTVYGNEPKAHTVAWPPAQGTETDCGPFRLELAILQGTSAASRLPPEEWALLNRKSRALGGLYIYSDGVRVLPYGRNDYDWLDIERNRTKSASYYYFSYRNMFGAVELDSEHNGNLRQKAGREGFAENKAYRQLQGILRNFFLRIAADFFRVEGVEAEAFIDERDARTALEEARAKRSKQRRARVRELRVALDASFEQFEQQIPEKEVTAVMEGLEVALETAQTHATDDDVANALIAAERDARASLEDVRGRVRVTRPRGVHLSKAVERDLRAHAAEMKRLEMDVIKPAEQMIEVDLEKAAVAARGAIDRRVRLSAILEEVSKAGTRRTREEARILGREMTAAHRKARNLQEASQAKLEARINEANARVAALDLSSLSQDAYVEERASVHEMISTIADANASAIEAVTRQVQELQWPSNGNGSVVTREDVTQALEADLDALQERSARESELVQLGMAIEVINHEFDSTIRAIRSQLRRLGARAEDEPALQDVYDALRASFDHLDGYLTLFTPLQRRLYRRRVAITGAEIEQFVRDLFANRLEERHIELRATPDFRRHEFTGYPSTYYPVFVNLVDNAVFWTSEKDGPRWIELDAAGAEMIVSDSGPGVPGRDREAIFELGFSLKPGGRGAGLRIARDVLEREDYELILAHALGGARFIIRPKSLDEGDIGEDQKDEEAGDD